MLVVMTDVTYIMLRTSVISIVTPGMGGLRVTERGKASLLKLYKKCCWPLKNHLTVGISIAMHVIVIVMVEGHSIPSRLAGLEVNTALLPNKINQ